MSAASARPMSMRTSRATGRSGAPGFHATLRPRGGWGRWSTGARGSGGDGAEGGVVVGVRTGTVAPVLIAHEPVDGPERQAGGAEREYLHRLLGVEVEDDELADHGQHGQQDHREDHAEDGLEDDLIRRIELLSEDQAEQDLERQVPDRGHDHHRDQQRQDQDDGVLELLVDRERAPPPARRRPGFRQRQSRVQASSKSSRGRRGSTLVGSPWPRLQRKFDFTRPSGKNSALTFALSNPDMPPTSSPTARAASMK